LPEDKQPESIKWHLDILRSFKERGIPGRVIWLPDEDEVRAALGPPADD
jgi:hypothetical protein